MAANQLPSSCLPSSPSEAQRLLLLCVCTRMLPCSLLVFISLDGEAEHFPLVTHRFFLFTFPSSFLLFDPVTTMMPLTVDLRRGHFSDSLELAFLSRGRSDSVEAVLLVAMAWFWPWTRTCCFSSYFFHRLMLLLCSTEGYCSGSVGPRLL